MAATPPITVVSGIPRSGTSLMMSLLGRAGLPLLCDEERAPDDDNPEGYFEYAPVRRTQTDASWVAEAPGRAVKVIHSLVTALPADHRYRVVLMRRPMREILESQDRMLARKGLPKSTPDEADAVFRGFERQLGRVRRWLDESPNVEWIEVEHADLYERSEATMARVFEFLGLDADCAEVCRAVKPELRRVREPARD